MQYEVLDLQREIWLAGKWPGGWRNVESDRYMDTWHLPSRSDEVSPVLARSGCGFPGFDLLFPCISYNLRADDQGCCEVYRASPLEC